MNFDETLAFALIEITTLLCNMNQAALVFVGLVLASILPWVCSKSISLDEHFQLETALSHYERLAKRCFIDDYSSWLQRESELLAWFYIAQLLKWPIYDGSLMQEELNRYRLQHQCLRIHEHLPLAVGHG
jgi:hypothetical protein